MYRFICAVLVLCCVNFISADICVIHPMITQKHTKCKPSAYCPALRNNETDQNITLPQNITYITPGSTAANHYQTVRGTDVAQQVHILSLNNILFTRDVVNNVTYKNENGDCDPNYLYRSFSGSCNNLENPNWGRSNMPYYRFLWPRYTSEDGNISRASNGNPLPDVRYLSTLLFPDEDRPSDNYTLAAMQWGQIIAHDTSLSTNPAYNCCTGALENDEEVCCPIKIPANDSFYGKFHLSCMNMARSYFVYSRYGCEDFRDQISNVTHYMDLSNLYGSDALESASLRQFTHGLLQVSYTTDGREFPPKSVNPQMDCSNSVDNAICFRAGDFRINQNTELTCLQTVLLREHNRIARELYTLNPNWDDDTLFQTARSILIAIYQHISFAEWLPVYLDEETLDKYQLKSLPDGYTEYREDVNAASINSFVTGAFRGFHSAIQGRLLMMNSARCPVRELNISDWMNRPGIIVQDSNYDELLTGLATQAEQDLDRYFTTQMTEMMFHGALPYGEDLESFDMQRGRDHGIPSYNNMRELCGYERAESFDDLIDDMGSENAMLLSTAYESVEDIDFFAGGMLEYNTPGHKYGPTFTCIIIEQFVRKKFGDRYWYEVGGQNHSFTVGQLQEIRKVSLSRLLCDNGDNITSMQPNSFEKISERNEVVSCDYIPKLNLSLWT